MTPLRVAVVGAGHLGTRHAEKLAANPAAQLVAVCDCLPERAAFVAARHGSRPVPDYRELVGQVDAVTVATPTASHAQVALAFLEAGVHVLVEKPITSDSAQARELVAVARQRGARLAVGHVERFNPALVALERLGLAPRFIESYRISPFRFRSMDIGVVHDLMIHDLDIMLQLIRAPVRAVEAVGVGVFGRREDLANARLAFEDGSVAVATASRVSLKSERKIRIFAEDTYVTLDFDKRSVRVLKKGEKLKRGEIDPATIDPRSLDDPMAFILGHLIEMQDLPVSEGDPLADEIADFLDAARTGRDPAVPGEQGLRALEVAERVVAGVERSLAEAHRP